ncbi:hypothetical protein [Aeromicrobium sp. Root495]|uniref:hypothetical protein n=1 Tax=Aeromicrobium sp. Root495 TaxID=1736550 RepID=UPI000AA1A0F1|nr:hypothetical protein [Aeromicrobium sp. Root495]
MRSVASLAAWVVAVLAVVVALPAGWTATHVTSEDGFVSLVGPLVQDEQVRDAVIDEVTAALVDDAALPVSVPASLEEVVRSAVRAAAERVAGDPGWQQAWDESIARTHRSLFQQTDGPGYFSIDAAPVADYVLDKITGSLPVQINAPSTVPVVLETVEDDTALEVARQAPTAAVVGGLVALLAALASVALARRRGVAVAGLGVGLLLSAAVLWPALGSVADAALDEPATGGEVARTVRDRLVQLTQDSAQGWLTTTAVAGVVLLVLGAVVAAVAGRRR